MSECSSNVTGVRAETVDTANTAWKVEGDMAKLIVKADGSTVNLTQNFPAPEGPELREEFEKIAERLNKLESEKKGQTLLETTKKSSTPTDDEQMSSLQVPVDTEADITTFLEACEDGKLGLVKRLLSQKKVDINCRDKNGRTAVMMAASYGHKGIFDFLVGEICDLSAVDDYNSSVIHFACAGGNEEIVNKLLDKQGFNIERKGMNGRTPLMCALASGAPRDFVERIIDRGANTKTVDDKNNNILHFACMGGNVELVKYRIRRNRSPGRFKNWKKGAFIKMALKKS